MKKIKLTKNKVTLVDDEDFDWINQWKWGVSSHGYAMRRRVGEQIIYLHRIVNKTPIGFVTDHINRNKLDNRKCNLRIADMRINSINRGEQENNTSGKKGVSWNKQHGRWESYIWLLGKKIHLGLFSNLGMAIHYRENAEKIYHAI